MTQPVLTVRVPVTPSRHTDLMRLLHTSDWHLGRSFHGFGLIEHQRKVLTSMVEIVGSLDVEVVVISGDLYDRAVPPLDAVELFSDVLGELRAAGAVVVAITGNHDSPTRVGFASGVLAAGGVHIYSDARPPAHPSFVGNPSLSPLPY